MAATLHEDSSDGMYGSLVLINLNDTTVSSGLIRNDVIQDERSSDWRQEM